MDVALSYFAKRVCSHSHCTATSKRTRLKVPYPKLWKVVKAGFITCFKPNNKVCQIRPLNKKELAKYEEEIFIETYANALTVDETNMKVGEITAINVEHRPPRRLPKTLSLAPPPSLPPSDPAAARTTSSLKGAEESVMCATDPLIGFSQKMPAPAPVLNNGPSLYELFQMRRLVDVNNVSYKETKIARGLPENNLSDYLFVDEDKTSSIAKIKVTGRYPVYLNVYDIHPINCYTYWAGLGVYHAGVQVHGAEYSFWGSIGIQKQDPKDCEFEGFTFRKGIMIGWTELGPEAVEELIEELGTEYTGDDYNLLTRNCNNFSNDACIKLTGNSIPGWVNRLARILCRSFPVIVI